MSSTIMLQKVAEKAVGDVTEQLQAQLQVPLLDALGEPNGEDGSEQKTTTLVLEQLNAFNCCTPQNIMAVLACLFFIALWCITITFGYWCCDIAAVFASLVAVAATILHIQLSDDVGMNRAQNEMREFTNRLAGENNELHTRVDDLRTQVDRAQEMQQKLANIAETQGSSVDKLVDLVKDNWEVLREMKKSIKAEVAQRLIEIVMQSDKDGDFNLGDKEIDELILRLNNIIIHGSFVEVREPTFRAVLAKDNSLKGVMDIVKTIILDDEEVPEEEKVFNIGDVQQLRGSAMDTRSSRRGGSKRAGSTAYRSMRISRRAESL